MADIILECVVKSRLKSTTQLLADIRLYQAPFVNITKW